MGRRKRINPLINALEKLQIKEDDVYTCREDEGNIIIITTDGKRCLYHTKGPVSPNRNYHRVYSEINNHA